MRRLIAIATALALGLAGLVIGTAAKNEGSAYKVMAIFDTASNLNVAGDLKVAGVIVGKIGKIELTPNNKAAVTLIVERKGIGPFKRDARCEIIVTSLIGEQPVQCDPGSADAPELETPSGEDLPVLPVTRTSVPVPVDRFLDTFNEPSRDSLRIFLNELGVAMAARGEDLAEILRRSNPTLRKTNEVLEILARQNRVLRDLIAASDRIQKPLARDREQVADSIVQINAVAQAAASRREDLRETIRRMPPLLRELKPTMKEVGELSDETAPILADLKAVAPELSRFIIDLGPFAREAVPAAESLGETTDIAGPILTKANPVIKKVDALTKPARPVARNLSNLLTDIEDTGGYERLMDLIFYLGAATGSFDSISHFTPARLLLNLCAEYATSGKAQPGCSAKFEGKSSSSGKKSGSEGTTDGSASATVASSGSSAAEGQEQLLDYLLGK